MTDRAGLPLTVAEAAERRRSIRAYAPDPVPRDDIEAILRVASLAPSAFNLQPWRFVVVERHDVRERVAEAAWRQRQLLQAPAVIVLYTDMADALTVAGDVVHPLETPERRARALASVERQFAAKSLDEREAWGYAQGYIALGYLVLAAEQFGYQTSPMLGFDPEAIKRALDLPSHVRVPALIAIGRGAEDGSPHHRHALTRLTRFV